MTRRADRGAQYQACVTRRSLRQDGDPKRHAVSFESARSPRYGRSTFDAVCGAQVARVLWKDGMAADHFTGDNVRDCRRCARAVRRG